jgi:hypothetical protein
VVWAGETVAEPLNGYTCPAGNTEGDMETEEALLACQVITVDWP